MCGSRSRQQIPRPFAADAAAPPSDVAVLVSDDDREQAADLVGDAVARGYLRLDELDDRLQRAWGARTRSDLESVLTDLPLDLRRERIRRAATERAHAAARAALGAHLWSYASVMALLVGIWLTVALTSGSWYPWPIWPALGWGIGLLGHVRAAGMSRSRFASRPACVP